MRYILLMLFALLCSHTPAWAASAPRILKVAARETSPYISEFGEEKGYFYEIVTKAFEDAGYQLDIQFYPPLRALKLVETGERDILIPSTTSENGEHALVFSQALNGSSTGYIKFKSSPDTVLPARGTEPKPQPSSLAVTGDQKVWSKSFSEKTIQLIDMLNQKRVPYIVADKLVAADVIVSKRPHLVGQLEFTNPPISKVDFHVAFSKKSPWQAKALRDFDASLDKLKKNGTYEKILMRYGAQSINEKENTLVIGTVANADMKLLEEMAPIFLKNHPGVSIRWNIIEENLLRKRIFSSIALNENVFDIVTIGQNETRVYANKGWIAPLSTPAPSYDVDDLMPVLRDALTVNHKLFALPFYAESSMTYYRKDLFAKKGLVMPPSPTYQEIRELAQKAHDPTHGTYGICLRGKAGWGENSATITSTVKAFGGRWFDENWQPLLASREWVDAVQFYMQLVKDFGPADAYKNGYGESLELFAKGRCAIWIDATVAASYLSDPKHSSVAHKVGFAEAPQVLAGRTSNWKWTWAFGISVSSQKKALAQEFMEWATSKEYIELVAAKRGWALAPPGTRQSTYKNPKYIQAAPFADFVYRVLIAPTAKNSDNKTNAQLVELDIPEFPALGNTFGNYMSDVMKNKRTVADALQLSQREVKRIMYHSGYYKDEKASMSSDHL